MSQKTKTFTIEGGIVTHRETFHEVTFREPRFVDWVALGNPYVINDDKVFPMHDKIDGYLEKCLIRPENNYLVIQSQADIKFAVEASNWIVGFFLTALLEAATSPTLPTTSRSDSGSTSTV